MHDENITEYITKSKTQLTYDDYNKFVHRRNLFILLSTAEPHTNQ